MWYDGRNTRAHRFSYAISIGDVIDTLILHKCDNPSCVNPNHLYAGTAKDNVRDRNERNPLNPFQSGLAKCKLSDKDIKLIRSMKGQQSLRDIAYEFNVSHETIRKVLMSTKYMCKEGYYI